LSALRRSIQRCRNRRLHPRASKTGTA
jgi:hypothetical protein